MEIINDKFELTIYGFGGTVVNGDYVGTAFKLMDRMWKKVKGNELKNKGLNVFVYDDNNEVFAGVELDATPDQSTGLEQKTVTLTKYAYHKHIGPYDLIRHAGQKMRDELNSQGLSNGLPYIEIYGHWTSDASKLETELLMSIE